MINTPFKTFIKRIEDKLKKKDLDAENFNTFMLLNDYLNFYFEYNSIDIGKTYSIDTPIYNQYKISQLSKSLGHRYISVLVS